MNPAYLGDSYDIVKRFFCTELSVLGYTVTIEPMFTGSWNRTEREFFRFIGAQLHDAETEPSIRTALLFDPDTGVHRTASRKHISIDKFAHAATKRSLVFSFDQSFSRQHSSSLLMEDKLRALQERGIHAMYYDSHARFLFASMAESSIAELRKHLVSLGMPETRLIACASTTHRD